jgi:ornithine carbamoyltransferase
VLDNRGSASDTSEYLSNWISAFVVRHDNISLLNKLSSIGKVPIINAMTSVNHHCEILSDIYSVKTSSELAAAEIFVYRNALQYRS